MPLPESGGDLKWPPEEWLKVYARYREHAAWFSGNPNQLAAVYFGGGGTQMGWWRTNFDRFWARSPAPQRRLMLHEPIAAALATTSSDLLFSEPPDFFIPEGIDASGMVQERLNELVESEAIIRTLTELAETVAALGGGFLRVTWDKEFEPDHPMLTSVDADAAIPEFHWGRMVAVTFWGVVEGDAKEKEVWRQLERHEPGYILTGLYRGTQDHLGTRMPLDAKPGLQLPDEVVETQIDDLTAVYIPNVRPNRIFRGSSLGRSDYDGLEAQMDALDEAATSLMRDLRLARARLIVPQEVLEGQGKGGGSKFDLDQEVWEAAPIGMATQGMSNLITSSQFAIRADDHLKIIKGKLEEIVAAAGYSNATFGLEMSRTVPTTATEIGSRERQSFLTRGKKITYWMPPLAEILEVLLAVDSVHFQNHEVYRPRVDFPDSIRDDPQQMATVVHILRAAEAASAEVRVRMVHPKWTDAEVAQERDRILEELAKGAPQSGTPQPEGATSATSEPNGLPMDEQQRAQMDQERLGNFATTA